MVTVMLRLQLAHTHRLLGDCAFDQSVSMFFYVPVLVCLRGVGGGDGNLRLQLQKGDSSHSHRQVNQSMSIFF